MLIAYIAVVLQIAVLDLQLSLIQAPVAKRDNFLYGNAPILFRTAQENSRRKSTLQRWGHRRNIDKSEYDPHIIRDRDTFESQIPKYYPKSYSFFHLANSTANGYLYGYAPSIVKENGVYHAFYCSPSHGKGLDSIRYIRSTDGVNWSKPEIVLSAKPNIDAKTRKLTNRAACDPSLVYYNGYYYLYYTNNYQTAPVLGSERTTAQGAVSVARSRQIDGKYLVYTKRGTWEDSPLDVQNVVLPQVERYGSPGSYGAGQQTVLVKDGQIYMWYSDDSPHPGKGLEPIRTYFLSSNNPVSWDKKPIKTSIVGLNSFDIRYDRKSNRFILIGISNQHTKNSFLVRSESVDGLTWSTPKTLIPEGKFPRFAHNNGVSSDNQGNLVDKEDPIVGFGAPYNLRTWDEWGRWDLFGVRVKIFNN